MQKNNRRVKERSTQKEKVADQYPGVRLEPGWHDNNCENSSTWNPQIKNRLRQYNPRVLAIDGLMPYFNSDPTYFQTFLPGLPYQLNEVDNSLFIVHGDMGKYHKILHRENYPFNIATEAAALDNQFLLDSSQVLQTTTLTTFLVALGTVPFVALSQKKTTRREFVRAAVGLAGVLVSATATITSLSQISTNCLAPFTRNETEREVLQIVASLSEILVNHWWLDGRTALMIAKTQDAIDYLGLPKNTAASVVTGTAHLYKSEYLKNQGKRSHAIKEFGINLLHAFDQVFKEYQLDQAQRRRSHQALLDYCASTVISSIRINRNSHSIQEDDIGLAGNFKSPQVVSALAITIG